MEGLRSAQAKVRLVALPTVAGAQGSAGERNRRFQDYLSRQSAFRGGEVKTAADAKKRVFEALSDAVVSLTQRGVQATASTRFDVGAARGEVGGCHRGLEASAHHQISDGNRAVAHHERGCLHGI